MCELESCAELQRIAERIDESVPQWCGYIERMRNDRIVKRIYVGVCVDSCLVGQPWKRWIDFVNDCLKKRGSYLGQARRMVYDRNE